jgi:hypothetical protein
MKLSYSNFVLLFIGEFKLLNSIKIQNGGKECQTTQISIRNKKGLVNKRLLLIVSEQIIKS